MSKQHEILGDRKASMPGCEATSRGPKEGKDKETDSLKDILSVAILVALKYNTDGVLAKALKLIHLYTLNSCTCLLQ